MNPDSGFNKDLERRTKRLYYSRMKRDVMEADFIKGVKGNVDHSLKTVFHNFKHIIKFTKCKH